MTPLILKNGRSETLFDPATGCLRMRFDGHGLIQMLSRKDAQQLKRALHDWAYPSV